MYYYTYPYYYRVNQNEELIEDIAKAINGEYTAINCYKQLADLAPTQVGRNRIAEIRRDEIKHFQTFSQIYTNLTGEQPKTELLEECPDTYAEGLEFAFSDEQK